jgi:hypothetical protein
MIPHLHFINADNAVCIGVRKAGDGSLPVPAEGITFGVPLNELATIRSQAQEDGIDIIGRASCRERVST